MLVEVTLVLRDNDVLLKDYLSINDHIVVHITLRNNPITKRYGLIKKRYDNSLPTDLFTDSNV